jgi:hypothetical protein
MFGACGHAAFIDGAVGLHELKSLLKANAPSNMR